MSLRLLNTNGPREFISSVFRQLVQTRTMEDSSYVLDEALKTVWSSMTICLMG